MRNKKLELIVIAAGNGKRMGDVGVCPKILYPILNSTNLNMIIRKAKESCTISKITFVIRQQDESLVRTKIDNLKIELAFKHISLFPIQSSLGDGNALYVLLKCLNLKNAIVMWGDCVIQDSRIFNELLEKNTLFPQAAAVIPITQESSPYVLIQFTPETNVATTVLYSKYNEVDSPGAHDNSIFLINCKTILASLTTMHNVLWKNGKYTTHNSELNFLNVINYLDNLKHNKQTSQNATKCVHVYETDYKTLSFNSVAELAENEKILLKSSV